MIQRYGLLPEHGSLRGSGLKLDLQTQEGRYRVDFMANEWLVIEIDGAAYHSSPEARARDRVRDDYFEELGYSVLRIPAKIVFANPDEAVKKVRSAFSPLPGERHVALPAPASGFTRLRETGSGFMRVVEEMNNSVARQRAIDDALLHARNAASNERTVIESALEIAQRQIRSIPYLTNDRRREIYEQSNRALEAAFLRHDLKNGKIPEVKM